MRSLRPRQPRRTQRPPGRSHPQADRADLTTSPVDNNHRDTPPWPHRNSVAHGKAMLSDLRESGGIEQDADAVLLARGYDEIGDPTGCSTSTSGRTASAAWANSNSPGCFICHGSADRNCEEREIYHSISVACGLLLFGFPPFGGSWGWAALTYLAMSLIDNVSILRGNDAELTFRIS
ncbi:hypothetical protein DMH03_35270 [Amycolatopsis sp. WAC 01376]|nr:hypothetical protein DMH03_35270 [Amycolatopsis sp. WAC 01376]